VLAHTRLSCGRHERTALVLEALREEEPGWTVGGRTLLALALRARLLAAMQEGSQPIAVDEHRRRGWWQRVWGWIAYGLLRLGVLVSGERQRY
jgi:hypothetical protein